MHGNFCKTQESFALHFNFCLEPAFPPLSGAFTSRIAILDLSGSFSYTFFLFAYPYYFVMLAQKKSKQKRPVQKKVTEWCSFAAFE
jgi:hypothetical protein